jgi:UDP-N-acetylmuramate dehydrogenase
MEYMGIDTQIPGANLIESGNDSKNLIVRGKLLLAEPMNQHTSWATGGSADRFFVPRDIEDVSLFLSQLDDKEEITWLGLGSNLLVRDGGIRGSVIAVSGVLNDMSLHGSELTVGAGLACAKAARFSAGKAKTGAEFLAGIPGTIGGALAMNAGAFGSEMWDIVVSVETIDRRGARKLRSADEFEVGYRSVNIAADEWFISAKLKLKNDEDKLARANIRELLAQRSNSQPLGERSCGSVFRNPDGDYAARLIELCGLKGKRIGGACVSEKHANFIINTGAATSTDIESLILFIQEQVLRKFDVHLQTEVRIVGEHA